MYLTLSFSQNILIILVICETALTRLPKEYCNWEDFTPACSNDEVIVITEAKYGLMKQGKCVESDWGEFIGCGADVLGYLDAKCSGLSSCEVGIADKEMKDQMHEPCPDAYLEATYTCQKVISVNGQKCGKVKAKQGNYFVASLVSQKTSCGISTNPWILEAQTGQRINLTLIDFSWKGRSSWKQGCQHVYGHLMDMNNEVIDICGSSKRRTHIHISSSHQVHVALKEDIIQNFNFLIEYQAIGCPDIIPPANAWMRKDDNDITVGCHNSADRWQMKCVGNHWIGVIGNCTKASPVIQEVKQTHEFGGNHVFAFAIGCAAIVVCCITVTFGVYIIKRYKIKLKSKYQNGVSSEHGMYLVPQQSKRGSVAQHTLQANHVLSNTNSRNGQPLFSATQTLNTNHQQQDRDTDSVKYYVLERSPGYSDNQIS